MNRPAFSLILAASLLHSLTGSALTLYVAPGGNDSWSGRKPVADGADGPLATLPAALQAMRRARAANTPEESTTILLRGGTYELADPVELRPEDSGAAADRPLLIAAFPSEHPVLSGGRRIQGWKPVPGKPGLWETTVAPVANGDWYFRQLFVNGNRRQRARTPNDGFYRIDGASPQDKPVKLKFKAGEIKKEWAEDGGVEVIALLAWADIRMQIRAVDESTRTATLAGNPRPSNKENNARYYIENAPDALDAPGEWYLNRQTGLLQYWAAAGEDPNQTEVIAPKLEDLFLIQGDLEQQRPVRHVVIRGITFQYTDWTLGDTGYADTQAAIATRGDVRGEGAVDCRIEDCRFQHLAGYALEFGRGCQRIQIVGNEISDMGGGGVRLGEPSVRQAEFDLCHSHTVTDNYMHRLGRVYPPAVGVFILQSGQNRIAHNHIHDLYYTAVSVGWTWGYRETPCRENLVEFNHLHHIGQAMLSDMGAVYTLGIQRGTIIRNNVIHDVESFTYGGWGLYPDEGSSHILWENNIVYRTKSAGFHQHYGRENLVRNNVFAFGREHQVMRTRAEQHTSFIFENNIVYFDSGQLLGSNWSNDRYQMDRNVYYDARPGASPDTIRFAGATLEQWRERGHDRHSLIADPRFEDAAAYDFRLKPESPALPLGFKPIDRRRAGVRPRAERK